MTKEEYKQKYKQLIEQSKFRECKDVKECYIIMVHGKRITVNSGKSVWGSKGAAKNALRNHLDSLNIYNKIEGEIENNGRRDYNAMRDMAKEAENEWMAQNVLIIPLSDFIKGKNRDSDDKKDA